MNKPTFASVTSVPCTCAHLDKLVQDRNVPVEHISEVGEYHLVGKLASGGTTFVVLYHCPFCGGALPVSRRSQLFAAISDNEATRLRQLVRDIETVEDVSRVLGKPDDERRLGAPIPLGGTLSPPTETRRVMTFASLSTVADIEVAVDGNDDVEVVIVPKYLGPSP